MFMDPAVTENSVTANHRQAHKFVPGALKEKAFSESGGLSFIFCRTGKSLVSLTATYTSESRPTAVEEATSIRQKRLGPKAGYYDLSRPKYCSSRSNTPLVCVEICQPCSACLQDKDANTSMLLSFTCR